ncbi:hypothetical protein BJP65_13115 [Microbacterium sp. BH-3-3-3]|nr:hypothetical protein BJP65_13115 [Microbacterium sp. BH-3-3-3]
MIRHRELPRLRTAAVGVFGIAFLAGMAFVSPATAEDESQAQGAVLAVDAVNPDIFDGASRSTYEAAEVGASGEVTIESASGEDILDVVLPDTSGDTSVVDGLAVLNQNNGSSIVPVPQANGSVAIHAVLNDSSAPESFEYTLKLDEGDVLVSAGEGGGFGVFDAAGSPRVLGAEPWAKDANGVEVATRYEIVGDMVIQHVDHHAANYAYPIVADPYMRNALVQSHRWETSNRVLVTPTQYARGWAGNVWWVNVGNAGFDELVSKQIGSQRGRLNNSARNQYICHVGYAPFKSTWNLETSKGDKGLGGFVRGLCN